MKSYYELLGVREGASLDEIRAAYRKLASRLHPDKRPGDKQAEERFKEISAAYVILSDPERRAKYERERARPRRASGPELDRAQVESWVRARRRRQRGARMASAFQGQWWGRPVPVKVNAPIVGQPYHVPTIPGFFMFQGYRGV